MKVFKIAALAVVSMIFVSCAHHDNKVDHHHHEDAAKISYEGKCAYSVENAKFDVPGNPEFKLQHEGTTYYFSSQEKLNLFKKDIPHNVERANKVWMERGSRRN